MKPEDKTMAYEKEVPPPWLNQALLDPESVFADPEAVANHPDLSLEQKIAVLRAWEYDAAEVAVAEEEGMQGPGSDLLQRILSTLARLTDGRDAESVAPSKQHGLV